MLLDIFRYIYKEDKNISQNKSKFCKLNQTTNTTDCADKMVEHSIYTPYIRRASYTSLVLSPCG